MIGNFGAKYIAYHPHTKAEVCKRLQMRSVRKFGVLIARAVNSATFRQKLFAMNAGRKSTIVSPEAELLDYLLRRSRTRWRDPSSFVPIVNNFASSYRTIRIIILMGRSNNLPHNVIKRVVLLRLSSLLLSTIPVTGPLINNLILKPDKRIYRLISEAIGTNKNSTLRGSR